MSADFCLCSISDAVLSQRANQWPRSQTMLVLTWRDCSNQGSRALTNLLLGRSVYRRVIVPPSSSPGGFNCQDHALTEAGNRNLVTPSCVPVRPIGANRKWANYAVSKERFSWPASLLTSILAGAMRAILGALFAGWEVSRSWPILPELMGLTLETGTVGTTAEPATVLTMCRLTF